MSGSLQNRNIGFIGLGLMGKPMCLNLHRAGADLHIYNRTYSVAEEMQQPGLHACETPAQVAGQSECIIMMVADTRAVEEVVLSEHGILSGIQPGALLIDMGTTAVTATRELAARVRDKGADYIDAPVSGGQIGAIEGQLSIMAGGASAAIERAQAIFDELGKSTVHIGDVGTGQVTKAANQVIVGLNIGAVAEALLLAKHAGADLNRVREALMGGFAASRILEVHGQRMIDQAFEPGGKVTTQHKDMDQAIQLATGLGLKLPASELNRALYAELIEAGKGNLDHSALYLALDKT